MFQKRAPYIRKVPPEGDFSDSIATLDYARVHGCFAVSVYQKTLQTSEQLSTPKIHGLETQAVEMILPRCKAQKMKSAFRTSAIFFGLELSLGFLSIKWPVT